MIIPEIGGGRSPRFSDDHPRSLQHPLDGALIHFDGFPPPAAVEGVGLLFYKHEDNDSKTTSVSSPSSSSCLITPIGEVDAAADVEEEEEEDEDGLKTPTDEAHRIPPPSESPPPAPAPNNKKKKRPSGSGDSGDSGVRKRSCRRKLVFMDVNSVKMKEATVSVSRRFHLPR